MNARQAKKYKKKVVIPFFLMDEMCLISMTVEEQKEYFKARKKFLEKYCHYKHYRDKGNIGNIRQKYYDFQWSVGEANKKWCENVLKNARKHDVSVHISPTGALSQPLKALAIQEGYSVKDLNFSHAKESAELPYPKKAKGT